MAAGAVGQRTFGARATVFGATGAAVTAFFVAGLFVEHGIALGGSAAFSTRVGAERAGVDVIGSPAEPFLVGSLVGKRPWLILRTFVLHGAPEEKAKTNTR